MPFSAKLTTTRLKRAMVAAAVAGIGGVALAALAPAQATQADNGSTSGAQARSYRYLKFVKNHRNPTNSKLQLVRYNPNATPRHKVLKAYRAGSGVTKDSCALNQGWLPNGKYKIEFHRTNYDGIINGHVIKLSDKRCHNGTQRTELFIHSEMTPSGGQGSVESERWDGTSDYKSNGCIKLKPTDIKNLFGKADHYGWPGKLYVK